MVLFFAPYVYLPFMASLSMLFFALVDSVLLQTKIKTSTLLLLLYVCDVEFYVNFRFLSVYLSVSFCQVVGADAVTTVRS